MFFMIHHSCNFYKIEHTVPPPSANTTGVLSGSSHQVANKEEVYIFLKILFKKKREAVDFKVNKEIIFKSHCQANFTNTTTAVYLFTLWLRPNQPSYSIQPKQL